MREFWCRILTFSLCHTPVMCTCFFVLISVIIHEYGLILMYPIGINFLSYLPNYLRDVKRYFAPVILATFFVPSNFTSRRVARLFLTLVLLPQGIFFLCISLTIRRVTKVAILPVSHENFILCWLHGRLKKSHTKCANKATVLVT